MRTHSLKPAARTALRVVGWVLSAAALVFFGRLVARNGLTLDGRDATQAILLVGAGAAVYGSAVGLLAVIWSVLAEPRSGGSSTRKALAASYLKSQFAKYLPGNIFQYAARHALGRQLGLGHASLASAAVLEAILLISAASFIVALFGATLVQSLFPDAPKIPGFAALLVLLIIPTVVYFPRIAKWQWLPRNDMGRVALLLSGYIAFFCVFGSLFLGILIWSTGVFHPASQAISSASLAWLVGFLVPGAPAGAGLREAALTLATDSNRDSPEVLSAIVLFRLVTLLGDFLAFLVGCLISRRMETASLPR